MPSGGDSFRRNRVAPSAPLKLASRFDAVNVGCGGDVRLRVERDEGVSLPILASRPKIAQRFRLHSRPFMNTTIGRVRWQTRRSSVR